jgi:hypothetical protein
LEGCSLELRRGTHFAFAVPMSDRIPPGPAEPNPPPVREPERKPLIGREPAIRKAPLTEPPTWHPPVMDPNRRSGAV